MHSSKSASRAVADREFLKSQGIMDYSLLLGVKKKLMPITSEEGDRLAKDGEATWYPNLSNAHESYHMGIIDILQKWNWSKRAERFTKAVLVGHDLLHATPLAGLRCYSHLCGAACCRRARTLTGSRLSRPAPSSSASWRR